MSITVLNPGLMTTVQDMGRVGYQQFGVSVSGVMDPRSAAIANILVGNPEDEAVLECTMMGPQDDAFTQQGLDTFLSETYSVTNEFDRMGCRLDGPVIQHVTDGNIISDGIAFGAIQVPSEGKPIIMLGDRQTTGGYTKIANVISADFRLLGQLKAGDKVKFEKVSIGQAQEALLNQRAAMKTLRHALDG